ncbi:hypothetical protein BGZ58_004760, partial [Dissophora ornata]
MATFNIPVPLNTMQLYKTKKMREVDMLIAREQDKEKTVLEEKVEILYESGGKGKDNRYIKMWFQHGVHYAKLYVQQCHNMGQRITDKRARLEKWRRTQDNLVSEQQKMDSLVPPESGTRNLRLELKEKQGKCLDMIMHLNLFNCLVIHQAYEGSLTECMDKVADFYSNLDKWYARSSFAFKIELTITNSYGCNVRIEMLLNIPGAAIEDDSAEWTEVADSLDNLTVELPGEHETTSPAIEAPEEIDLKDDDPDDPL